MVEALMGYALDARGVGAWGREWSYGFRGEGQM